MDACANDAEIAAALAAVEEADALTLARAEGAAAGAAGAASAASTGAVAGDAKGPTATDDDADSSRRKGGQPGPAPATTTTTAAAAAAAPAFERPSDEAIVAQENEIRAQIASSAALVGKKEPLSALREEYSDEGASVFASKAEALGRRYGFLRRARGDGNCFFRSFMFALAEGLLERRDLTERNR